MSTMAANPYKGIWYTLELFPTEGNWQTYEKALGGTSLERKNDNAGFDLFTTAYASVPPGELAKLLDLGVKARMTKHWWSCEYGSPVERSEACHFWLAPRSSIMKTGVRLANSLGVIDRSYRGVLMAGVLSNTISGDIHIEAGTRVVQILAPDMGWIRHVLLKHPSELDETSRGEGGFGSTGR